MLFEAFKTIGPKHWAWTLAVYTAIISLDIALKKIESFKFRRPKPIGLSDLVADSDGYKRFVSHNAVVMVVEMVSTLQ